MRRVAPTRAASWLGLAYAAAIALFVLIGGADEPGTVLLDLLFIPWIAGPALAMAACVGASRQTRQAWAFVVFELAIMLSTLAAWVDLVLVNPDAQNGVALAVTVPLCQYAAVIAVVLLARLAGWRIRAGWPD